MIVPQIMWNNIEVFTLNCINLETIKEVTVIKPFLKEKRIKLFLHKKNRGYGGPLKTAADFFISKLNLKTYSF